MEENWVSTDEWLPDNGIVVDTKIDDGRSERNMQPLKRYKNLWFTDDGLMYVYYTPTHWKYQITNPPIK